MKGGAVLAAWAVLGLCAPVRADEIVLRSGRTISGTLLRGERESRINTFGSTAPDMTLGVVPIRTRDIDIVRLCRFVMRCFARWTSLGTQTTPDASRCCSRLRGNGTRRLPRGWPGSFA